MTQPYLGEIRLFAGNFAPKGNAYCAGQLMSIQQNSALFSLLGTYYGGNGTTTFALPDLRGRLPVGQGQGPGLSSYTIGSPFGSETVTITQQTTPTHNHLLIVSNANDTLTTPSNNVPGTLQSPPWTSSWVKDANKTGSPAPMATGVLGFTGGSQPHNNIMQIMAVSVIIALQGIFPSRN